MRAAWDDGTIHVEVNGHRRVVHGWRQAPVLLLALPAGALVLVAFMAAIVAMVASVPAVALAYALGHRP